MAREALLLVIFLLPASGARVMAAGGGTNITEILSAMAGFGLFSRLLRSTGVAMEIDARSSLTVLCPPDSLVRPLLDAYVGGIPAQRISDLLRYHVLLQYLDLPRLPAGSRLLPTLFQATGRAPAASGSLNLTKLPSGLVQICPPFSASPTNVSSIASTLRLFPYTLGLYQITRILSPQGLLPYPTPPPLPIDITGQLEQSGRFAFFLLFLRVTGVDAVLGSHESGAGVTVFAPTDAAFLAPRVQAFKMLPAQDKILVLEYHALDTFYPLGTLNAFKNPVTPTIATTDPRGAGGPGTFTVNVSSVGGVVTISDGSVSTPVVATILEHEPVAIFAIDQLLFPKAFLPALLPSSSPPSPSLSHPLLPPPPPLPPPPSVAASPTPTHSLPSFTPSPSPSLPTTSAQTAPSRAWRQDRAVLSVLLAALLCVL